MEVSNRTLHIGQRAYLAIEQHIVIDTAPAKGGLKKVHFTVTVRNLGNTPAYDVDLIATFQDGAIVLTGRKVASSLTIGPKQDFSLEEFYDIGAPHVGGPATLTYVARYKDVFYPEAGSQHLENACLDTFDGRSQGVDCPDFVHVSR